jgi:hypothetical protein
MQVWLVETFRTKVVLYCFAGNPILQTKERSVKGFVKDPRSRNPRRGESTVLGWAPFKRRVHAVSNPLILVKSAA